VATPPVSATLTWLGDLRFRASVGGHDIILDSGSAAGPSPPQALILALAGCMAIDVADVVRRGRHALAGLDARVIGDRAQDPPRRFMRFTLHFIVRGDVPDHAVERAIQLSRDKYCSVWHSLREDIALETTFEVISGT
jgi:putative redox protein